MPFWHFEKCHFCSGRTQNLKGGEDGNHKNDGCSCRFGISKSVIFDPDAHKTGNRKWMESAKMIDAHAVLAFRKVPFLIWTQTKSARESGWKPQKTIPDSIRKLRYSEWKKTIPDCPTNFRKQTGPRARNGTSGTSVSYFMTAVMIPHCSTGNSFIRQSRRKKSRKMMHDSAGLYPLRAID